MRALQPFLTTLCLATGCVLGATLPASTGAEESATDEMVLHDRAVSAYERGDYEEYRRATEMALAMGSHDPRLLAMLAGACALTNRPAQAMELLYEVAALGAWAPVDSSVEFEALRGCEGFANVVAALNANRHPISRSHIGFRIDERDLIPEGMAYDPVDRVFYVGSMARNRILRVDEHERSTVFLDRKSEELWPFLGMEVDATRRRLWACRFSRSDSRKTGLWAYDLDSGSEVARFELTPTGERRFLNDLAITTSGQVYATDTMGSAIWMLVPGADALQRVFRNVPLAYPNGIAICDDERYLFVAHLRGILRIDLESGFHSDLVPDTAISLVGIDGLYVHGTSLVAVQNGIEPPRVVQLQLSRGLDRVRRMRILERGHPAFEALPTTGAIKDDSFYYIANSQVGRLDGAGRIVDRQSLVEVMVFVSPLR